METILIHIVAGVVVFFGGILFGWKMGSEFQSRRHHAIGTVLRGPNGELIVVGRIRPGASFNGGDLLTEDQVSFTEQVDRLFSAN